VCRKGSKYPEHHPGPHGEGRLVPEPESTPRAKWRQGRPIYQDPQQYPYQQPVPGSRAVTAEMCRRGSKRPEHHPGPHGQRLVVNSDPRHRQSRVKAAPSTRQAALPLPAAAARERSALYSTGVICLDQRLHRSSGCRSPLRWSWVCPVGVRTSGRPAAISTAVPADAEYHAGAVATPGASGRPTAAASTAVPADTAVFAGTIATPGASGHLYAKVANPSRS